MVEKEYVCAECGVTEKVNYLVGKPRKYCPACVIVHKREYVKEYQRKKRSELRIGSETKVEGSDGGTDGNTHE